MMCSRLLAGAGVLVSGLGRTAHRLVGAKPSPAADRQFGAALLAGLAFLPVLARLAPVVALTVWGLGAVGERRRATAEHARLVGELAEAVPLLQLAAAGGLTVRASVTAVAPWLDGALGQALARAVASPAAGALADELDSLADGVGAAARPLAAALAAADRYGAPLQAPLAQLAVETRLAARRLGEEQARQVPVRLLFPLVAGVLPAFVLLTVVPLLVSSLRAVQVTAP